MSENNEWFDNECNCIRCQELRLAQQSGQIPLWTIDELESQCEDWVEKLRLVEPAKSMLRVKLREACNWIEKNVRPFDRN